MWWGLVKAKLHVVGLSNVTHSSFHRHIILIQPPTHSGKYRQQTGSFNSQKHVSYFSNLVKISVTHSI